MLKKSVYKIFVNHLNKFSVKYGIGTIYKRCVIAWKGMPLGHIKKP